MFLPPKQVKSQEGGLKRVLGAYPKRQLDVKFNEKKENGIFEKF